MMKFQINDTLILINITFAKVKEIELHKTKLLIKSQKHLIITNAIKFNNSYLRKKTTTLC